MTIRRLALEDIEIYDRELTGNSPSESRLKYVGTILLKQPRISRTLRKSVVQYYDPLGQVHLEYYELVCNTPPTPDIPYTYNFLNIRTEDSLTPNSLNLIETLKYILGCTGYVYLWNGKGETVEQAIDSLEMLEELTS